MSLRRFVLLLVAVVLGAGCGKSSGVPGLGLSGPEAVAVFHGWVATKNPTDRVHPYLAIANTGADQLTLVDAVDDSPVVAPVLVQSLAVPTAPRPAFLTARSLADDTTPPTAKADLLVVVSPGSSVLQVVTTWDPSTRVDPARAVDLGALAPGAEILAVTTVPVPQWIQPDPAQPGSWQPTPGKVWVLASLAGGKLAVVEFDRDANGVSISANRASIVVQDLGFEALSLSAAPDLRYLYAATVDEVVPGSGIFGVAQLDMTLVPGAWPIRALDARAGTRLVAAWNTAERLKGEPDAFCLPASPGTPCSVPPGTPRVYAAIDPGSCGRNFPVSCGLAVLDPATGKLAADPVGEMPYLSPITMPAIPLAIAISGPTAKPPTSSASDQLLSVSGGLMRIAPESGQRNTTAVAAVPAGDGLVYYVDLGRWQVPLAQSMLRSNSRTRVLGGNVIQPGLPTTGPNGTVELIPSKQILGFWPADAKTDADLTSTGSLLLLPTTISVTPGYTDSDTWTVTYQGVLPGLALREGSTGTAPDGSLRLALQTAISRAGGATQLVDVVRLYDPTIAVHVGDLVQIAPGAAIGACLVNGQVTTYEAPITAILPPAPAYPGGAVALDTTSLVDIQDVLHPENRPVATAACVSALEGGVSVMTSIRAGEYVLTGQKMGYAGRPAPVAATDQTRFTLSYSDLVAEAGSSPGIGEDGIPCPILPWPADPLNPTNAAFATCTDRACRDQCERLVLARKARRIYYVADRCDIAIDGVPTNPPTTGCFYNWDGLPLPDATGPVIAFRLGFDADPARRDAPPDRELAVTFSTQSGIAYSSRRAPSGFNAAATLPTGVTTFDRSIIPGKESQGYRFFVSYPDNYVLDFSPSDTEKAAGVIR